MLFGSYSKLIKEGVMPNPFHVIPIVNYSIIYRISQIKNSSSSLCLITYINLLIIMSNHYSFVFGSTHDCGETASWSIITSYSSLTLTRTIINYYCGNFVSHLLLLLTSSIMFSSYMKIILMNTY